MGRMSYMLTGFALGARSDRTHEGRADTELSPHCPGELD